MTNSELQIVRIAFGLSGFSPEVRKIAAAITVTEMGFRGILSRSAEYVIAALLILFGRSADSMSVGISQVSLRHTKRLRGISPAEALLLSSDAQGSIETCCMLIQSFPHLEVEQAIAEYNGRSTPFYRKRVRLVLEEIEAFPATRCPRHE